MCVVHRTRATKSSAPYSPASSTPTPRLPAPSWARGCKRSPSPSLSSWETPLPSWSSRRLPRVDLDHETLHTEETHWFTTTSHLTCSSSSKKKKRRSTTYCWIYPRAQWAPVSSPVQTEEAHFFSFELIYEEILSVSAWQVAMRENIEKINVCKLSIFQSEADSANPSTTMKR